MVGVRNNIPRFSNISSRQFGNGCDIYFKTMAKKIFKYVTFALVALFMSSCSSDDKKADDPDPVEDVKPGDELIGRWTEVDSDLPYILVFNADNTGNISFGDESRVTVTFRQYFKWSVGVTSNGISYCNILTTSGDFILDDGRYEYMLIGNDMNFGDLRFRK